MNPHPISLTDYQMATIREAAKLVPVDQRGRLLEMIADELLPLSTPVTDDHVHGAIQFVLGRMHLDQLCCGVKR